PLGAVCRRPRPRARAAAVPALEGSCVRAAEPPSNECTTPRIHGPRRGRRRPLHSVGRRTTTPGRSPLPADGARSPSCAPVGEIPPTTMKEHASMHTSELTQKRPKRRTTGKIKNLRYLILGWLLLAGILNYMDRTSVSIAAPHMIAEL